MDSGKLLLLGACLVVIAPLAAGCSCAQVSVDEAINGSSYIFSGVVTAIEERSDGYVDVNMAVSTVWKGPDHRGVEVTTHSSSATCGFPFQEGESYLVYTDSEHKSVSLCSRTAELGNAEADLAALGEGEVPSGTYNDPAQDTLSTTQKYWIFAVTLVVFSAVFYRRSILERLKGLRE